MNHAAIFFVIVVFAPLFSLVSWGSDKNAALTVYTARKTHLIEPIFEAYTKATGVKIRHINGKDGVLIQKLKQEGKNTKADILMMVDAGNLGLAAQEGLLVPLESKKILNRVPAQYRGGENKWVALSLRARTIFYNKNKVEEEDLKSYEDLADPEWKGKLCLPTSRKVYNQSLVAAMMTRLGEEKTKQVVSGWVANLAKPEFSNDTLMLEAIDRGVCQVGIANTYYMARLAKGGKAKNVAIFFPKAENGGVHINVSGAGVVKESKNKEQAVAFLEWLLTDEAQKLFSGPNQEYPVVETVSWSPILANWGKFSTDKTPLGEIGPLQKKAVFLMDSVKFR